MPKKHVPALAPSDAVSTARKKTVKIQQNLHAAEAELHTANKILGAEMPHGNKARIEVALDSNIAAEEKVHQAAEDLEAVKELLADSTAPSAVIVKPSGGASPPAGGRSGEGAQSLVRLLGNNRDQDTRRDGPPGLSDAREKGYG